MRFRPLLLLVALLPLLLAGQDKNSAAWISTGRSDAEVAAIRQVDERSKPIEKEVASLPQHDWAGDYYWGDGLGANVRLLLAPSNGFVFTWNGCMGLYGHNYGPVTVENGVITLKPEEPNPGDKFGGIATQFIALHWGDRHYLIPQQRIIDFANAYNKGFEPRESVYGMFLLRDGDEKKKAAGKPPVPAEYRDYFLDKPITAHITAVTNVRTPDQYTRLADVVVDAGTRAGLKPGMEMAIRSRTGGTVRITRVGEVSCEGVLEQWAQEKAAAPGSAVSTQVIERHDGLPRPRAHTHDSPR